MDKKKLLVVFGMLVPLLCGIAVSPFVPNRPLAEGAGTKVNEPQAGNTGNTGNAGANQVITKYDLSGAPTELSGTGDSLNASEYGNRTDSFTDQPLYYNSGTQTTTGASLAVPMGEGWEGHRVFTNVTSITENRTWVANSGFDTNSNWTYLTHDEPSIYNVSNPPFTSQWVSSGGNPGGAANFQLTGYYYDAGGGLYGYWYDIGDKAYAVQNLTINRGDVTAVGVSLDYWADINWASLTGFCEIFVSIGDPDNGGTYLWHKEFDSMSASRTWFSSGYVSVDVSSLSLPNISLWVGLRTTAFEWWRPDTQPHAMVDNLVVYVTAKATPSDINLKMNGVTVDPVLDGGIPVFGLGTAWFYPSDSQIFRGSYSFANFTWTPSPNPPDPNYDINIALDVDVTVWARRYNVLTINSTELFTLGDNYAVQNNTAVSWETNHYAAVPGGYSSDYFFNVTLPLNRDVSFVAQPYARTTNLTSGWTYGAPGDGSVNISVYDITKTNQNGFWLLKGSSPNMISNIEVWSSASSQWLWSDTFRADESTRFRATLSAEYANEIVYFTVYSPDSNIWTELQAVVNASGYATTQYVNLGATNASVGLWQVQAFCTDSLSSPQVHNIGFFTRDFDIVHSTAMSVKYPVGSGTTWTKNVTYGQLVLLQVRVNDSDNGNLLSSGSLTYTGDAGSGSLSDLGTGEYGVTIDTSKLASNGQYEIYLVWSRGYYDTIYETFTLNIIYTTNLFSADAPGIDVPRGYNAELTVEFKDQTLAGIDGASIICNWSMDSYSVTPDAGTPGKYLLSFQTNSVPLGTYKVMITAEKDFFESRSIVLSIQVRELYTSAIPSTSLLSLPVGYTTSFTITYTDTDHGTPITGAASEISCNWSSIHKAGDLNYTVAESSTPGMYDVNIYSADTDVLKSYNVIFNVQRYGAQNHTFSVTVVLRTHLTSFYLVNPVEPSAYTGNLEIYVRYYDTDADVGIQNGSLSGYYVHVSVLSPTLPGLLFTVQNGTDTGEYVITIAADQWGAVGSQNLKLYANWTGPTVKFYNETISVSARVTASPTDIYIGQSPTMTPYGENVTFSIVYYDVGNETGIVNGTGAYAGNVHIYVDVLTPGQSLTQSKMVISEVDFVNSPGEYQIEFNSSFLSGLVGCELRVWLNWTEGVLPYYANQSLQITVYATYRLTTAEWTPLPITAYDELINLSLIYRDVLSGAPILDAPNLSISVPTYGFNIYYEGDSTGVFLIQVDTSAWAPGANSFTVSISWSGAPYYQNRTSVTVTLTTRDRYTELTHGLYTPIEYGNNLTIVLTYRDLDDYTTAGMNSGTLSLDASLSGHYWVTDNGDGTYTVVLSTLAFSSLGMYHINASIVYGGSRFCSNANDSFYLSVIQRRALLASALPDPAPYLTLANISITYTDGTTNAGITGATVDASCSNSSQTLQKDVNYWVVDVGTGEYQIRISTIALGNFGGYSIAVTVSWTGAPYYSGRDRTIAIEVSRREARLLVTKSPLNTPFMENVSFEFTATDGLVGSTIILDKTNLAITYGAGNSLPDGLYSLTLNGDVYTVTFLSTSVTSSLIESLEITLDFSWGNTAPYYSNATTSTQVSITARSTQGTVLSTPPASFGYNMTAVLAYSDYLTRNYLPGATVSVMSLNASFIQSWWTDQGNGRYEILVDSNGFSKLGKYLFLANITWTGSPYYKNVTNIAYSVVLNPVATVLTLQLVGSTTNYLGDIVSANITFREAVTGIGIDGALVTTNWNSLYGTDATITPMGNGVYGLHLNTSGLNAQLYQFSVSAAKFIHLNKTIDVGVLLAAIPVGIFVTTIPEVPVWGDVVIVELNITNARNGQPVIGGNVNVTISGDTYSFVDVGSGIYQVSFPSVLYSASDYPLTIHFQNANYESRQMDMQLRISKVPAKLLAQTNPYITVNGANVTVYADYLIQSNSTVITVGSLTFTWAGGTGILIWSPGEQRYVGHFSVSDILVGSYQVLIQASSTNYKSVNTQTTLEIREITTDLTALSGKTVLEVISGNVFNITVYLNNTDLGTPISGANVTYSLGESIGALADLGNGYYTVLLPSATLNIKSWILTVTSSREGYSPSSMQFTVIVKRAPTEINILTNTQIAVYYGQYATFKFEYWDTNNDTGVLDAQATYLLSQLEGNLTDFGNGTYVLSLNSSIVPASSIAYQISVSFQKEGFDYANVLVRLLVNPIATEIIGSTNPIIPYGDNYTQAYSFFDSVNDRWVTNATRTVFWSFGTVQLLDGGNGTYYFTPSNSGYDILQLGSYPLRVVLSKENYARATFLVNLTIRPINTTLIYTAPSPSGFVNDVVEMRVTYWDLDHNRPVVGAANTTDNPTTTRLVDSERSFSNGTYVFYFRLPSIGKHEIVVTLSDPDYEPVTARAIVFAVATEQQIMMQNAFQYGAIAILMLSAFAALWFRVLSIPKMLRWINSMIAVLSKGKIPSPKPVRSRKEMLHDWINEEMSTINITKPIDDVAEYSIVVDTLDTETLLTELATVVGLTAADIEVLRRDLDKMKPSEKGGFLNEVIRQERARRAKEISEARAGEGEAAEEPAAKLTEEELGDLKEQLISIGIEETEADLMVEQARGLSKSEIRALLDQLGGMKK